MNSDIPFSLYPVIPIISVSIGKTWGPLPRLTKITTGLIKFTDGGKREAAGKL